MRHFRFTVTVKGKRPSNQSQQAVALFRFSLIFNFIIRHENAANLVIPGLTRNQAFSGSDEEPAIAILERLCDICYIKSTLMEITYHDSLHQIGQHKK
jgi:hypothetical protein